MYLLGNENEKPPTVEELIEAARKDLQAEAKAMAGEIHETHTIIERDLGGDECSKCWRCTCHHPNALSEPCEGNNGRTTRMNWLR